MVSAGQYMVVADTALGRIRPDQTPTKRSKVWRPGDEPLAAVTEYLKKPAASSRCRPERQAHICKFAWWIPEMPGIVGSRDAAVVLRPCATTIS